jgi:hypothetical protein
MKPMTEQIENMELLKDIKEMIETQIGSLAAELTANQAKTDDDKEADQEEMLAIMDANMKANQEEMKTHTASIVSRIDAQHERMMAWLGRTEPTYLKANP